MESCNSPTTMEEMTTPLSPKRPRIDHTEAENSKSSITDITQSDRLILNMLYDMGDALTASYATTDACSHDVRRLGKSVQCQPPVGLCATGGDVEDGARHVQNSSSLIQPVTLTRAEEDVRCQADCSYEEAAHDEGTDMQNRVLAASEESNQREIQCEFREKSPCNKKIEEVKNGLSFNYFANGKSFSTKPTVCPSSSSAEVEENNGETLELQNVASCDGKTEDRFNEDRKQSFSGAGAMGKVAENMNTFNVQDCEKKQQTTEELIAKVGIETADVAETRASVSISQIVTEGDNDAASFSVIDPAIWIGADRAVEENHTAGCELSEMVCKDKGHFILNSKELQGETVILPGLEQTWQTSFQSREQLQYEKDCLSNTDKSSITHDQTGDKSDIENHRRLTSPRSSSSATSHTAEDQRQGSQDTVGYELKEQDQSESLSGSPDHQDVPTQAITARMDKKSKMHEAEVVSMDDTSGFWLEDVEQLQNSHQDSIGNGFASYIESKDTVYEKVKTHIETVVEERDVEGKINGKKSEACEQQETNLAEIQLAACSIRKVETSGMLDSEEIEKMVDKSEQAQTEIVSLNQSKMADALSLSEITENQEEYWRKADSVLRESSQHSAHITNQLSAVSRKTICNTLKPVSDDNITEKTLNPKLCAANCNNSSMLISAVSDAVVPGINSCTDHSSVDPHNCNVRFSPAPSALSFTIQTSAGGYDTFEKIQFPPDDNDIDPSGLGNDPLLSSPPCQLLEKQPYRSKSHLSTYKSEKNCDKVESNASYNANGSLNNNSACAVVASPIPTADVIARGWPDQKPQCESTFQIYDCFLDPSAVSIESDSTECEDCDGCEFEMKKQFDTVLKELKLFFDISASDMANSSGETSSEPLREIIKALEEDSSQYKDQEESMEEPDTRETSLDGADDGHSLEFEAVGSCVKSHVGEQEVPLGTNKHQEAPACNELNKTEPVEREQRERMWSPSFMLRPLMEQLSQKMMEPSRRLEPLRTCTGPLRVGLSKRAKTRHLHHPHPYK